MHACHSNSLACVSLQRITTHYLSAHRVALSLDVCRVRDTHRTPPPKCFRQNAGEEGCRIVTTASLAGLSEATGLYGVTKHACVAATEAVASRLVLPQKLRVKIT